MTDIEKVWKEEEEAKRNRTLINPVRETTDVCAAARARIIQLNAEIRKLQEQISNN